MNLTLKMEKLPDNVAKVAVKLGAQSTRLTHVQTFQHLASEEEILDCLEEYGFGTEYGYARVIWQDDRGRQVTTYSFSEPIKEEEERSTINVLVNGLLEMAAEQRRFVSTMNATVESLATALATSRDKNAELQEEVMEERTNALALDLALQDSEKESQFSYKERALETLSNLGQQYIASQSALTPDKVRMLMQEHPELIDEMVKDEAIVEMVASRIMSSKMEGVDADG